jgi:DNA-binding response OmpR family regulator
LVYDDLVRARGGNEGRVRIFDEHVQVLEFSRIALAAQGFEVRVFANAVAIREAARTTAADARPSVLVLDLSTDGAAAEALPELRAAGIDAPVLWVSGGNVRASAPGGYLPKPYTGTGLGDAVAALLRRSPIAP